jgi:hypothetical protein
MKAKLLSFIFISLVLLALISAAGAERIGAPGP